MRDGSTIPDAAEAPVFTRPFAWLLLAHALQSLGWTSMVMLPLYLEHLGASRAEVGAIFAASRVGGIVSRPAVGWALDAWGRRPVLFVGTVVLVFGMLLVGAVTDLGPVVWISRLAFGIGVGATFTGYFTLAADLVPAARRTEGIAVFGISGLVPMAVAPLMERAGVSTPELRWFIPAMGLCVLSSLLALGPVRDVDTGGGPRAPVRLGDVLRAASARSLWSVWLAVVTLSALAILFMSFASVAADQRGVEQPGSLWLAYSAAAVGARLLGARLPDRVGPHNLVAPALALFGGAALVIAEAETQAGFLLAGALAGLAHGWGFPVLTSQVIGRAPARLRGSAMASFTLLWDLSALGASPAFGAVADATSDAVMFGAAAVLAAVAVGLWALLEHRALPRAARAAP